jgi:hypothetical protein
VISQSAPEEQKGEEAEQFDDDLEEAEDFNDFFNGLR